MDESFAPLETELKSLRLRRPGPALLERIGADLASEQERATGSTYATATNLNSWKWFGWRMAGVGAAAVATVAAVSWFNLERNSMPVDHPTPQHVTAAQPMPREATRVASESPSFQPVAATNVLYDLKDEGTVYVNGGTPARRIRYRYLDTYTLTNPSNHSSLKWSVPRDEVRVVPASFN